MAIQLDKSGLTREEKNLVSLWETCINKHSIPSLADYSPLGNWQDVAMEMVEARVKDAAPNGKLLKNVLTSRINIKKQRKPEDTRLIHILSGDLPQIETLPEEDSKSETIAPPLPKNIAIPAEVTRNALPIKDEYIRYSEEVSPEGFEGFHSSCFWAMLSTVAGRRVVIDLARRQYTPLIVMLSARSTFYAKTDTAEAARDVLKKAGLDWLLGLTRTTPQKLLLDMSGPVPENYGELDSNQQAELKIQLAMSGQRGWHTNEFGKTIKAMMRSSGPMSDFVEILLQISDCPEELPTGTISRGNENIKKPYVAIIGTLTPASIKAVAGKNSELWSDGFLARFLFSCPPYHASKDQPYKRGQVKVPDNLATGIRNWHDRLGVPKIEIDPIRNEEGKETGRYEKIWLKELPETVYKLSDDAYEGWRKYRSALKSMVADFPTTDFDGSYGRLGMMALRVAALAASVDDAPLIEYKHWALGQEQAEMWRESLHQLYAQVNSDETITAGPTIEDKVLEYVKKLQATHPPTAREIAKFIHMDTMKLEPILQALVRSGDLEVKAVGKAKRYNLPTGGTD